MNERGDFLSGNSGNDYVYGSNTTDVVCGGAGKDLLVGGGSDDLILGDGACLAYSSQDIHRDDWSYTITATPSGNTTFYELTWDYFGLVKNDVDQDCAGDDDVIYAGSGNDFV